MGVNRHVALLRGINVGGKNIIKMVDLRASFETLGFIEVETYIQSGNVVFSSKPASKTKLSKLIEKALTAAFGYASSVVLVSAKDLQLVVAQAPAGFGKRPDRYRYDVLFVKEPLTTEGPESTMRTPASTRSTSGGSSAKPRRVTSRS